MTRGAAPPKKGEEEPREERKPKEEEEIWGMRTREEEKEKLRRTREKFLQDQASLGLIQAAEKQGVARPGAEEEERGENK